MDSLYNHFIVWAAEIFQEEVASVIYNVHPSSSMFNLNSQLRRATFTPTIHKILLQSPSPPPEFVNLRSKSMGPCCVETAIRDNNQNPDRQNRNNLHLHHNPSPNSHNCKDFSSCPPAVRQNATVTPICPNGPKPSEIPILHDTVKVDDIWCQMVEEAENDVKQEPILSGYYTNSILSHKSLDSALAHHLSIKLGTPNLPATSLVDLFLGVLRQDKEIIKSVEEDLRAVRERDPACISYVHCFLNFKGFSACQAQRISHRLWIEGRKIIALLIQNRVSEVFAVDIHPGARIGRGILLDHATGLVVGETAVIGNNVSILHNVTLGGTGKIHGDRHPKIGDGVLIGAGTCVLGSVRIGDGAKVGAGSVVLKEVPPRTTAVGNPARLIGGKENPVKLDEIPSFTMDHTSDICEWSDYVI